MQCALNCELHDRIALGLACSEMFCLYKSGSSQEC